jgi:hypothetical protein
MSAWRKSSYSSGQGDNCVEIATAGSVLVRDTVDRDGTTLTLTPFAWRIFLGTLR